MRAIRVIVKMIISPSLLNKGRMKIAIKKLGEKNRRIISMRYKRKVHGMFSNGSSEKIGKWPPKHSDYDPTK